MIVYNKDEIKESLSLDKVFDIIQEFGGNPEYTSYGILSSTICHNEPGVGSRKLYYYSNSNLFRCYTGCDCYFDIFELVIKAMKIQHNDEYSLYQAVRWIADRFGLSGEEVANSAEDELEDWKILDNYSRIQELEVNTKEITLKEYDKDVLDRFHYDFILTPWIREGISQEAIDYNRIGFYPGEDQITIPHYDKNNRFIGLRGRSMCQLDCEMFGKYRPIRIGKTLYNHPLGMNLYNLNNSKNNIKIVKKAIIFEGEKSCLLYQSYFGIDNDISVACCGSSVSAYQIQLLLEAGAEEIIIAFDRQFQKIGDNEFQHLKNNLIRLRNKYKNDAIISFIFDKKMITGYKASPIDEGPKKFLQLFKERIIL